MLGRSRLADHPAGEPAAAGGRASSFTDPVTGELVDNCQHVSMACCTNLADFCRRVGIDDDAPPRAGDGLPWPRRAGLAVPGRPRAGPVPPGRQLPAASFLKSRDKLQRGLRPGLPGLGTRRTARRVVRRLAVATPPEPSAPSTCSGRPVLVSALNERLDQMDVGHARKVFLDGFFRNRTGFQIELPLVSRWASSTAPGWRAGCAIHEVSVRLTTGVRDDRVR